MRRHRHAKIDVALRFADVRVGEPGELANADSLNGSGIGRLAGVLAVGGMVYCRWQVGPDRFIVTTSSARAIPKEIVARRADGEDVILMHLRQDGTSIDDLVNGRARKTPSRAKSRKDESVH